MGYALKNGIGGGRVTRENILWTMLAFMIGLCGYLAVLLAPPDECACCAGHN